MRKEFFEFFPESAEVFQAIWAGSAIVLDANVLLQMYRYTEETKDEFFKVLASFKERLWIPRQVADEFFKNRISTIESQVAVYNAALKGYGDLVASLEKPNHHPFVSPDALEAFRLSGKVVSDELLEIKARCERLLTSDSILSDLGDLFEGRVGNAYEDAELEQIAVDGKLRYERNIPPGYKDSKKPIVPSDFLGLAPYGDLIVWNQILDYAEVNGKDVIFITDDKKEDWWLEAMGKTIGPRSELVKEFSERTGRKFIMYSSRRFIDYYNQQPGREKFDDDAYTEISEAASLFFSEKIVEDKAELRRSDSIEEELKSVEEKIRLLESEMRKLKNAKEFATQNAYELQYSRDQALAAGHEEEANALLGAFDVMGRHQYELMNKINHLESSLQALRVNEVQLRHLLFTNFTSS